MTDAVGGLALAVLFRNLQCWGVLALRREIEKWNVAVFGLVFFNVATLAQIAFRLTLRIDALLETLVCFAAALSAQQPQLSSVLAR